MSVNRAINEQINLQDVRRIAVDETAHKRGHNYVTIFSDLDSGDVILVIEGRKQEVFEKLYEYMLTKGGDPQKVELF